jgi:hypothetical protein
MSSGDPFLRRVLPIDLSIGKGSISVGNPETPTILILDWKKMSGTYAIVPVLVVLCLGNEFSWG